MSADSKAPAHGQRETQRPVGGQARRPIRVLLVDDQPLFRGAIRTLINEQPDFVVVGEAVDGVDAIRATRALRPDIVVMDIEMPVMNGVEAVRHLRDEMPEIRVVVLTVSEEEDYLFDAVRLGAHGYLLKDLQPDDLYQMLRAVARGETPISPVMAGRLLAEFRRQDQSARADEHGGEVGLPQHLHEPVSSGGSVNPLVTPAAEILTRRELETLQYVADGLSNKEIGVALSITEGTVKNHVHNALEKLQLENRIQAAAYVVREGFAHRPET